MADAPKIVVNHGNFSVICRQMQVDNLIVMLAYGSYVNVQNNLDRLAGLAAELCGSTGAL